MQEKHVKKNRKDWIEHYRKILSDGYYIIKVGNKPVQMKLYDDDIKYIEGQIKRLEVEITDGRD